MWFYRDETAIKPEDVGRVRLWVRNDVYGVEQVTED